MHSKLVFKTLSLILTVMLMSCPFTVRAQAGENKLYENVQTVYLDDGDKIETTTFTSNLSRSNVISKSMRVRYLDSDNIEVCAFIITGDFDSATRKCLKSYYNTTWSGGAWRVENPTVGHDTYTVYGSCDFVKRVLGIKIKSIHQEPSLSL